MEVQEQNVMEDIDVGLGVIDDRVAMLDDLTDGKEFNVDFAMECDLAHGNGDMIAIAFSGHKPAIKTALAVEGIVGSIFDGIRALFKKIGEAISWLLERILFGNRVSGGGGGGGSSGRTSLGKANGKQMNKVKDKMATTMKVSVMERFDKYFRDANVQYQKLETVAQKQVRDELYKVYEKFYVNELNSLDYALLFENGVRKTFTEDILGTYAKLSHFGSQELNPFLIRMIESLTEALSKEVVIKKEIEEFTTALKQHAEKDGVSPALKQYLDTVEVVDFNRVSAMVEDIDAVVGNKSKSFESVAEMMALMVEENSKITEMTKNIMEGNPKAAMAATDFNSFEYETDVLDTPSAVLDTVDSLEKRIKELRQPFFATSMHSVSDYLTKLGGAMEKLDKLRGTCERALGKEDGADLIYDGKPLRTSLLRSTGMALGALVRLVGDLQECYWSYPNNIIGHYIDLEAKLVHLRLKLLLAMDRQGTTLSIKGVAGPLIEAHRLLLDNIADAKKEAFGK